MMPKDELEETLLEIVDFERELDKELGLVKQEGERIVQQTGEKAKEIIEEEKSKFYVLDREYEENLREELEQEKDKILKEKEEKMERMREIDETKVGELISFAFEKVMGR